MYHTGTQLEGDSTGIEDRGYRRSWNENGNNSRLFRISVLFSFLTQQWRPHVTADRPNLSAANCHASPTLRMSQTPKTRAYPPRPRPASRTVLSGGGMKTGVDGQVGDASAVSRSVQRTGCTLPRAVRFHARLDYEGAAPATKVRSRHPISMRLAIPNRQQALPGGGWLGGAVRARFLRMLHVVVFRRPRVLSVLVARRLEDGGGDVSAANNGTCSGSDSGPSCCRSRGIYFSS